MIPLPTLVSRAGFGSQPDVVFPLMTDVSADLRGLRVHRGRSQERNQTEAGTAEPLLNNQARKFDPTYTYSPYWPNVVPMVKFQHAAVWESVEYPLHVGYVERWPISWEPPRWGSTRPVVVDGFAALATAQISGSFPQELSGQRIQRVLEAINWPLVSGPPGYWSLGTGALDSTAILASETPLVSIPTGSTMVAAKVIPEDQPVPALQHIQETAQAEPGFFFFDAAGRAIFLDRATYFGDRTSHATFTDDLGSLSPARISYTDLEPDYGLDWVFNEVIVSSEISGTTETVSLVDLPSRSRYFRRTESLHLPLISTADMTYRAQLELILYAQPFERFNKLTLKPQAHPETWPTILSLELGQKVTVERTPGTPAGITPETITRLCTVESIEHSISPGDWTVTLELSPADAALSVWKLDYSKLDSQTKLL